MPASAATGRQRQPLPRRRTAAQWPGCVGKPANMYCMLTSEFVLSGMFQLQEAGQKSSQDVHMIRLALPIPAFDKCMRVLNRTIEAELSRWSFRKLPSTSGVDHDKRSQHTWTCRSPAWPALGSDTAPAPAAVRSRCWSAPPLPRGPEGRRSREAPRFARRRPDRCCLGAAAAPARAAATGRWGWRRPGSCLSPAAATSASGHCRALQIVRRQRHD